MPWNSLLNFGGLDLALMLLMPWGYHLEQLFSTSPKAIVLRRLDNTLLSLARLQACICDRHRHSRFKHRSSPAASLPPELLLAIFELLRGRPHGEIQDLLEVGSPHSGRFLASEAEYGREHAERDLRACVLTCRAWRGPATDTLYADLSPRDERTWKLLVPTLLSPESGSSSGRHFASRVRRIVAPPCMRRSHYDQIESVLSACATAHELGTVVTWAGDIFGAARLSAVDSPPVTTLTLDALRYAPGTTAVPLGGTSNLPSGLWQNLRSLELRNLSWRLYPEMESMGKVALPTLQTLSIVHCSCDQQWLRAICKVTPALSTLRLVDVVVASTRSDKPYNSSRLFVDEDSDGITPSTVDDIPPPASTSPLVSLTFVRVLHGVPPLNEMPLPRDILRFKRPSHVCIDIEMLTDINGVAALCHVQNLRIVWRAHIRTLTPRAVILRHVANIKRAVDMLAPRDGQHPAQLSRLELCAHLSQSTWHLWALATYLLRDCLRARGVDFAAYLRLDESEAVEFKQRWRRQEIVKRLLW